MEYATSESEIKGGCGIGNSRGCKIKTRIRSYDPDEGIKARSNITRIPNTYNNRVNRTLYVELWTAATFP